MWLPREPFGDRQLEDTIEVDEPIFVLRGEITKCIGSDLSLGESMKSHSKILP